MVLFRASSVPLFPKSVSWLGLFCHFLQQTGSKYIFLTYFLSTMYIDCFLKSLVIHKSFRDLECDKRTICIPCGMKKTYWKQVFPQAFLDFRAFDFRGFPFTAVYNSILFSSPLVLLSNLDLRGFCFRGFSFGSQH